MSSIPVIPASFPLIGELIGWTLPVKTLTTRIDLETALILAGLDPKRARVLSMRNAFTRAARDLAGKKIIHSLKVDDDYITFQIDRSAYDATKDRIIVDFESKVTLNRKTDVVTASDPGIEALAKSKLAECLEERKTRDVSRLISQLFAKESADMWAVPGMRGAYLVPDKHRLFVDRIQTFVRGIGGELTRFPVPDITPMLPSGAVVPTPAPVARPSTPAGRSAALALPPAVPTCVIPAASCASACGIYAEIEEYQTAIDKITSTTRDSTLDSAWEKLNEADYKINEFRKLLGSHAAILEDHIGYVRALMLRRIDEVKGIVDPSTGLPVETPENSGIVIVPTEDTPVALPSAPAGFKFTF